MGEKIKKFRWYIRLISALALSTCLSYLFSLAVRTNPFARQKNVIVQ